MGGSYQLQRTGTIDACGRSFVKTSFAQLSPSSRISRKFLQKLFLAVPGSRGASPSPPPVRARWNAQAAAAPSFFGSKTRAQPCCIAPETVRDRSKPPAFACAQQGTRRGDVKNRMGRFDNIISVSLRSRASPAAADRV